MGILWTIGMRGIHDGKMQDGKTTEEKIKILEEVFAAQCAMLPDGAPKLFVPYKEAGRKSWQSSWLRRWAFAWAPGTWQLPAC